jgi:hypothetical protein
MWTIKVYSNHSNINPIDVIRADRFGDATIEQYENDLFDGYSWYVDFLETIEEWHGEEWVYAVFSAEDGIEGEKIYRDYFVGKSEDQFPESTIALAILISSSHLTNFSSVFSNQIYSQQVITKYPDLFEFSNPFNEEHFLAMIFKLFEFHGHGDEIYSDFENWNYISIVYNPDNRSLFLAKLSTHFKAILTIRSLVDVRKFQKEMIELKSLDEIRKTGLWQAEKLKNRGFSCTSVMDALFGIDNEIHRRIMRIKDKYFYAYPF